jgi:ribose transport system ATP-binding protein
VTALEARDITKSFGGNLALRGASLTVAAGAVHGVVGPNGAGKSTLLKIVCGMLRRDSGTITIAGTEVGHYSPRQGARLGLVIVPQETALCEDLTVAEAIVLGAEPAVAGLVSTRRMARRSAARCLAEMSVELPLNTRVSELAGPARRLTMFAHAVHARSRVIIVDEPTAGLDERDAETVVAELEKLRSPERAIIFVSHRFPEVVRLCDRVTVIRDGRDICTLERDDVTTRALSELILASGEEQAAGAAGSGERVTGHISLSAHGLHGRHLRDVSLDLRRGEILGLAGLAESGAEELMDVLGGDKRVTAGRLVIDGAEVRLRSPSDAVAGGIVYLPSERSRAVLADDPVRVNVAMPRWSAISHAGLVTAGMERRFVADVLARLGLTQYCDRPLGSLSGGNRQKALIARAVRAGARILILGNPTAGVDVRGTAEIHAIIRELAAEEYSIVLSSGEPEETAALADRVLALRRGRIGAELRGTDLTAKRVVEAMF